MLTVDPREPVPDQPSVYVDLLDTTQRLAMSFVAGEAGWTPVASPGAADVHVADRLAGDDAAPPLGVLVVVASPAPSRRALDAFAAGRVRAVVDAAAPEELPIALQLLRNGLGVIPTRVVEAAHRVPALRPRLERTLQLVLRGQSNRVIARAVHESEATAKRDVAELLRLFDAPNRLALAATAIRLGYQIEPARSSHHRSAYRRRRQADRLRARVCGTSADRATCSHAAWSNPMTTELTASEKAVLEKVPTGLFIGGAWRPAASGRTLAVEDPATEQPLCEVADGGAADATAALDAAVAAQAAWAVHPPRERSEILRRAFEAITERLDELALLMTLEMGKPVAESRAEVAYAAEFLRWFAEEAVRIDGRFAVAPGGQGRLLTMRQPVGPCLLITPWNFPMAMGTRKIGPALAAGCTMVVKPAQRTPLSMLALAAILDEVGLPKGVLNVLTSSSARAVVDPLVQDDRLRKLSFTGSTEVGRSLLAQAAEKVLQVSMELGGNAPFLVFEDADLDAAVDGAVIAKMRNIGEACTAANRFHVAAPIAEQFAQRLAERLAAMPIGRGTDDAVQVGPLIDDSAVAKVAALVDDAVGRGARALTGGARLDRPGHFFPPTVLVDVPADARCIQEEIFGPVAPITTFDDEAEAVSVANATEYGLVAYVFTRDLDRAFRVVEALETGMVGLNQGMVSNPAAPFGGVKQSGIGREGGPEGIEEYLSTKYVALHTPDHE